MMISPMMYIKEKEKLPYLELMKEREQLISYLHEFEKNELIGDRNSPEWEYLPSPEVKYQMFFDYLAELCKLMSRRNNEEYVDGCRTLQQDAEEYQDASMEGEM